MGAGWAQGEVTRAIDQIMGTEKRDERQPYERLKESITLFDTVAAWLNLEEVDEPLRPKLLQHILREAIEKEAEDNRDARSASELLGFTRYSPAEIDEILSKEHSREIPKNSRDRRALLKPVRLLLAGTHQVPPIRMRTARDKQSKWAGIAADALYHYLQHLRSNPDEAELLKAKILLIKEAEADVNEQADRVAAGRSKRRSRFTLAITTLGVVAAIAVSATLINSFTRGEGDPTGSNTPKISAEEARALELRYDGKDPRGYGKYPRSKEIELDSVCADKARPSEGLKENKPLVIGPDGKPAGVIELRRSTVPECRTIIWARVLWDEKDELATYKIPEGWILHVVAHRPSTKTNFDFPEPEDTPTGRHDSPILYALSPMITTASGCAYVEVHFTSGNRRTVSASTSCVKI